MANDFGICKTNKKFIDLTGMQFGRLTVVMYVKTEINNKNNTSGRWLCNCICGNVIKVRSFSLRNGDTQSCGCIHKESTAKINFIHGETRKKPEYNAWLAMKTRCINKKNRLYSNYGGRGIYVCDNWINSYETFLNDMGRRPSPNHSLDRIDVNGNYEPSNCRWATKIQQARNRTVTVMVSFMNKNYALVDICEILKLNYHLLRNKIYRYKVPAQLIFDSYLQTRKSNLISKN